MKHVWARLELRGAFPVQPEMPPINNALYLRKFKETTKIEEAMSPGTHRLDSSVNWDSLSQRKFWNAWDTQHLQTVGEETRRRGDEVLGLILPVLENVCQLVG